MGYEVRVIVLVIGCDVSCYSDVFYLGVLSGDFEGIVYVEEE